ncbi:type II secretion system F family protein [Geobacter sulfurreducens]|uniref:Type II secretion system inner membrane protein PulF n=1 Tax=Geobacter sulfurreducens (strain ATCC 51573 / DSM 12127 / PCA) TaxID=243231 RepID=Q74C90_GEOSL|nr:type II secretion system F family protein [Geobacter sulfurreducens]AAR35161.1 type II secretion system inner membrane protein PulF [Geobacter sulfurreducens PCA]ADI84619.1 type II secretion system inner membrane protein PulF [Geobacter sulfurreducens KN400]AJY71210.1 type II secretion system protein [Geobacter sulfurreducens]QVW33738.1 type II secretion system F family protein [Geobacter sulfurreducens]UAC02530.1 type II secretion system F family protein [Geobacter sulfurreducens]
MALYHCKLGSSEGRIITRELEAANPEMLRTSLEEQGFFVFEIKKKPLQFLWDKGGGRRKVDNKALLTLNQELLVLIKAGLPIIQALDTVLERVERGTLFDVLAVVREDVKGGMALSDALEKHTKVFPHLYVASVRAGERTGDLQLTIRRYIAFLKRVEEVRKRFISALVYPAILVTVATLAITFLLVYVVPTFSQVYADAGSQLPLPTRILIAFSTSLKQLFPLIIAAVIGAVFFFRRWAATESGRYRVDDIKIRIPFIGDVFSKFAVSSFTRTLATVIGSGIPIVESLKMSVGTLNNRVLERRMLEAVVKIEEGMSLSGAIESARIMPPLALRMLGVGESTGSLEEMLSDIAEYFEGEIDARLHLLTTAIEPAIMIVMGLVVGVIIVTMYLPVFKIAGTVG